MEAQPQMEAVGSANKLDGIVTKTDLVKYYAENCRNYFKVSDHMSIHYFSVSEQDSVFEVVKTMLGFGISRMIIVDKDKQPIGIVSTGDVFKAFIKEGHFLMGQNKDSSEAEIWSKKGGMGVFPAKKIMHKGIIKISYEKDLADAAKMMLEQNINALGVEDENQKLIGVIGKRDIVLALRDDSIVLSMS